MTGSLRIYSRRGCHLCDDAMEKVERLARDAALSIERIEKVDIDNDPALLARHGTRVPVIELDGEELAWGRISERGLRKALARRRPG